MKIIIDGIEYVPKKVEQKVKEVMKLEIEIMENNQPEFNEYGFSCCIRQNGKPVCGGVFHKKDLIKTIEGYVDRLKH